MKRAAPPIHCLTSPLTGNGPAYQEISERVRNAILDGDLAAGTRIPPILQLAHTLNASVCTVQAALAPLVKEGLLERRQRFGTYVRNRSSELGGIGVYFSCDFWLSAEMTFYHALQQELFQELQAYGGTPILWMDTRPTQNQTEPLPDIISAIKRRKIQGMTIGLANSVDMKWLSKLKIPTSAFTSFGVPGRVFFDFTHFFELGLQELQRKGCRTYGMILPLSIKELNKLTNDPHFFESLPKKSARYGLKLLPACAQLPESNVQTPDFETFGYKQYKKIRRQSEQPDGLLIFPDSIARGTITAILECSAPLKNPPKLVMHRNSGANFVNPLPTSWLVVSVRQVAIILVEQLRRQIEGKQVQPIRIPLTIETS